MATCARLWCDRAATHRSGWANVRWLHRDLCPDHTNERARIGAWFKTLGAA